MDKNKRGFTLIELLAVIVILAIIALIAVPVIMNVITKARKSAFEDSAYGIVKAGEMYYTNKLLDAEGMTEDQEFTIENGAFTSTKKLDVSGSLPNSGKITVTSEGKVALAISNGEYCIRKATTESSVKAEPLEDLGGTCNYKTVFTTASDGTSVPACITNNTECSEEAIKNGLKVGVKVNDSEPKDFYVISEDAVKGTITLIMNQNIGGSTWLSKKDYLEAGGTEADWGNHGNNNKGPITALNYLEKETSNWTNIPLKTYNLTDDNDGKPYYLAMTRTARARLITYKEAEVLGCTTSSRSCPTWLYENLSESGDDAYWTSSTDATSNLIFGSYFITYMGSFVSGSVSWSEYIRPVITISKTIM